jgi:hypothetical protein
MHGDELYELLPAIYRIRDEAQGGPLRDLLRVLSREAQVVAEDIAQLYDNWFIETCDEWVVPYIGDLLGVRPLHPVSQKIFSQRAWVANTLGYRRRKGTLAVLEQLARDVTGWPAKAVEYFQVLGTTQYLNHTRPQALRTPDLRNADLLERIDGPFDTVSHTAEVRSIASGRGRYNIPSIGVFIFRLQSYPLHGVTARQLDARRFTFSPLGLDTALFNAPQPETSLTQLAGPLNVEMPITRRMLHARLEDYYPQSLSVTVDGVLVSCEDVVVCNLSDSSAAAWAHTAPTGKVAIDPELGRIATNADAAVVSVDYHAGFSGDVGGGAYDRNAAVAEVLTTPVAWDVAWIADVQRGVVSDPDERVFGTLQEAVAAWNDQSPGTEGVIVILDSQTYDLNSPSMPVIELAEGSRLLLVAGAWPEEFRYPMARHSKRKPAELRAAEARPLLLGSLAVQGLAAGNSKTPGELALNGLLVEGGITVQDGNLARLRLHHCTLTPPVGAIVVQGGNLDLTLSLTRSICGPVTVEPAGAMGAARFTCVDSILHAPAVLGDFGKALDAPLADANIQASTIFGSTTVRSVQAGNSIFLGRLRCQRRQIGCVRFSYVPPGSPTPRRFHCQPDLGLLAEAKRLGKESTGDLSHDERAAVAARLIPAHTSRQYGHGAYAQLSNACAEQILTGAENGSELGVFSFLKAPLRMANLRIAFAEYLNYGLEAGIIDALCDPKR